MHPFDWGLFKTNGGWIFLGTLVSYCAAIWFSARQWRRFLAVARHWWIPVPVGIIVLLVMTCCAIRSLREQMTSAHYQEFVHMPAVGMIGIGCVVSAAVGIMARLRMRAATRAAGGGDEAGESGRDDDC